jgi:plasmid stabilization system protein ParE
MARPALVVRAEAAADVRGAVRWYEAQAAGLGREFLRAVRALFASLEREPRLYPVAEGEIRRALLRRFPYALYFTLDDEAVIVLACLHVRRDPAAWQGRR